MAEWWRIADTVTEPAFDMPVPRWWERMIGRRGWSIWEWCQLCYGSGFEDIDDLELGPYCIICSKCKGDQGRIVGFQRSFFPRLPKRAWREWVAQQRYGTGLAPVWEMANV